MVSLIAVIGILLVARPNATTNVHATNAKDNNPSASPNGDDTSVKSATESRGRLVVLGDSHSTPDDSWVAGAGCRDVLNLSMSGSGLLADGLFGSLHRRLPDLLEVLKPKDEVLVSLGFNDFDQHTVEEVIRERNATTKLLKTRVANVRWTTIPPYSKDRPMAFALDLLRARRQEWNAYIMTTPGAIDLAAPLGDDLEPGEDSGDHVHLSRSAKQAQQKVAAATLCPTS